VKGYKCLLASYACFYLVNFHPKEGGFPAFEVNSSNIIIFQLYNRYHYTQFIWVAAQAMLALPMLAPTVR
jgi:hypothetical protein